MNPQAGALRNLKVIDLTRVLAGPYCTMMLADMGANVIKVEQPPHGDDARAIGPFHHRRSAYFDSLNRNKQSIALDLKKAEDRKVFEELLAKADVLVENFRPGTLGRLGYDWDMLHQRWPKLILASISGFGQSGPYRDRAAYDLIIQAMSGMMSITGSEGGEPTRVGASIADLSSGLFAAFAILCAVHARHGDGHGDGQGQRVDIAMLDCQISLLENAIARHFVSGVAPVPLGSRHPSITPFQTFRSQGAKQDDLAIAAGNDSLFQNLCRTLERHDLIKDSRFADNESRTQHHQALAQELNKTFDTHPRDVWLAKLAEAGVPVAPIQTIADVVTDPQVKARNMIIQPDPNGPIMAGNPVRISGVENLYRPAPKLDADGPRLRGAKGKSQP